MTSILVGSLLSMVMTSAVSQAPPPVSEQEVEKSAENDPEDSAERSLREARRMERRQRRQQYRNAGPVERRQLRLERVVDMTARMYELDDMQKVMVRNEIQAMEAERRANMGADAEELDRLRDKMAEFWMRQNDGDDDGERSDDERRRGRRRWRELRQNAEFQQLRQQMRALEEKFPIDWDAAAARVEALLPPEQAERGRKRREERFARWRDRRREREDNGRLDPAAERLETQRREAQIEKARAEREKNRAADAQAAAADLPKQRDIGEWEAYVRTFVSAHELTDAQANAAWAILHDVNARAAGMRSALEARRVEIEKIRNPAVRQAQLAQLGAPIQSLFEELKRRLDGLLTAEQRNR